MRQHNEGERTAYTGLPGHHGCCGSPFDMGHMEGCRHSDERKQVAATILQQLGGAGFMAMIGMKKPAVAYPDGVAFGFKAKAREGINKCVITVAWDDTYTMEFQRVVMRGGGTFSIIGTWESVYCDQLVERFEQVTGLAARMPRFVRGA